MASNEQDEVHCRPGSSAAATTILTHWNQRAIVAKALGLLQVHDYVPGYAAVQIFASQLAQQPHLKRIVRRIKMRKFPSILKTASSVLAIAGSLALFPVTGTAAEAKPASVTEQGKVIAFDRKKGNCLACHQIEGGKLPGNIGPPLIAMKARYPDKAKLRAQIWDATRANPNSIMPPFGRHKVLGESEIDKIVEFIYTL
jgi:sulfur-oxidizing protein SoxX